VYVPQETKLILLIKENSAASQQQPQMMS